MTQSIEEVKALQEREEDEEVFYYNNGSVNYKPVDLVINVCPEERMMCYDAEVIKDIVFYFCETGKRNPKYTWIEDEFI